MKCRRWAGAMGAVALGLGCGATPLDGGPAPPQTCGVVTPCGGDLTGTWKVIGGCSYPLLWLNCPLDMPAQLVGLSYTGTLTFNSDMTYSTTDFVQTGSQSYVIPSSCVSGLPCKEIAAVGPGTCSGRTSCTCSASVAPARSIAGSGTYTVAGNNLTFDQVGAATIEGISYCVQDGLLHLETYETVISGGLRTTVTSDIVAHR